MKETTSDTIEFPATLRDALTELLRRRAQQMLATVIEAEAAACADPRIRLRYRTRRAKG